MGAILGLIIIGSAVGTIVSAIVFVVHVLRNS